MKLQETTLIKHVFLKLVITTNSLSLPFYVNLCYACAIVWSNVATILAWCVPQIWILQRWFHILCFQIYNFSLCISTKIDTLEENDLSVFTSDFAALCTYSRYNRFFVYFFFNDLFHNCPRLDYKLLAKQRYRIFAQLANNQPLILRLQARNVSEFIIKKKGEASDCTHVDLLCLA